MQIVKHNLYKDVSVYLYVFYKEHYNRWLNVLDLCFMLFLCSVILPPPPMN